MAMSESKLATLLDYEPSADESVAISQFMDAYAAYAADAEALTPLLTVVAPKAAMQAKLVGLSASGGAGAKLVAAVVEFWAVVALGLTSSFAGAVAITPPPHAGLAGKLASDFATNNNPSVTRAQAAATMAASYHSEATTGGKVETAGPTITDIS